MKEYTWKDYKNLQNALTSLMMSTNMRVEVYSNNSMLSYDIVGLNGHHPVITVDSDVSDKYYSHLVISNSRFAIIISNCAGDDYIPVPVYRLMEIWNRVTIVLGDLRSAMPIFRPVVWIKEIKK